MNSFGILLWDEIRGFVKSKVMIALWVGMPLLSIIMHFLQPDTEGIPISIFTGLLAASIGGLLAAVMLSVTMVNELGANVYDLYLIRPVKRWHLIVSKYLAVILCLTIATLLSLGIGLLIDTLTIGLPASSVILDTIKSLAISLAAMSISSAAGILIGMLVKSVSLAAVLSIYLGQQLSLISVLPSIFLKFNNAYSSLILTIGIGLALTIIIMIAEIIVFNKKQF